MTKLQKGTILKTSILTFCLLWLSIIHYLNEIPLDVGDGIMHLNISEASWTNPTLFLHHWGKPLFILLSSTFAQFGMNGMVIFNILIFGLTTIVGWKILNLFSIPILIQSCFPLVLLSAFDYSSALLAGLTEPLFSLFIMVSVWLIVTKKWVWFALLVSFVPFLRSEGQLAIVLASFVLVFAKQFKVIPLLLIGFILYGIVGHFIIGDFWWYFTTSPYHWDNDIYGHGNWFDYFSAFRQYLGLSGFILSILGGGVLFHLFKNKAWDKLQFLWLFFVSGVFLGIVCIHSYFWANGLNGSLGLTRIATQGMPSFVLISIYYCGAVELQSTFQKLRDGFFGMLLIILPLSITLSSDFPRKSEGLEHEVIKAAHFLKNQKIEDQTFFFHHPLFVYEMGGNPFHKKQPFMHYYCNGLGDDLGKIIKAGDYVIRDSQFGPQEAQMFKEDFVNHPELKIIKEFVSCKQKEDKFNEVEGVTIYQYVPGKHNFKSGGEFITKFKEKKIFKFKKGQEFLDIGYLIKMPLNNKKVTFQLSASKKDINFVFDFNESYKSINLEENIKTYYVVEIEEINKSKIYFWNPFKDACKVTLKIISVEK